MLYYPQLETGSVGQYPIVRNNIRRTVINALADGSQITMDDAGAASVRWNLTYAHLTSAELSSLQQLFEAASGSWQTFTFLDPTDNLLNWSEDLSQAVWQADPLLTISGGISDPLGGSAGWAVVNTAQAEQSIVQTLEIPSAYQYCLSLYARSDQPCSLEVLANSGQGEPALSGIATASWRRMVAPFKLGAETGVLTVGVRLSPGSRLYLFGLQLEAQAGAGGCKKTRDRAGVYPNTRFDQNILTATATGVNQYGASVKVTSNVAG